MYHELRAPTICGIAVACTFVSSGRAQAKHGVPEHGLLDYCRRADLVAVVRLSRDTLGEIRWFELRAQQTAIVDLDVLYILKGNDAPNTIRCRIPRAAFERLCGTEALVFLACDDTEAVYYVMTGPYGLFARVGTRVRWGLLIETTRAVLDLVASDLPTAVVERRFEKIVEEIRGNLPSHLVSARYHRESLDWAFAQEMGPPPTPGVAPAKAVQSPSNRYRCVPLLVPLVAFAMLLAVTYSCRILWRCAVPLALVTMGMVAISWVAIPPETPPTHTITASAGAAMAYTGVAWLVLAFEKRWRRYAGARCWNCGYPLKSLTQDRCPDCGTPFVRSSQGLHRSDSSDSAEQSSLSC